MKPCVSRGLIQHRNFIATEMMFSNFVRTSGGGKVIALVGCTQVGKSMVFERLVNTLRSDTRNHASGTIPLISITIATAQDGRISPKFLTLQMLKALEHPKYRHRGDIDECNHYAPSGGMDEGSMRTALEAALTYRKTMVTLLDEGHHLTHTGNERLRANVLQSVKCMSALERTLVIAGGYELAYRGFFDSAHFAGRLVVVDFPPYENNPQDLEAWASIIKSLSTHLPLTSNQLLLDHTLKLRDATNGSFGLLQKWLWQCRVVAESAHRRIDKNLLFSFAPPKAEHSAIRRDIEAGRRALERFEFVTPSVPPKSAPSRASKPFQQRPRRRYI